MIITLFNFAKRTNSTKRPSSGGTQYDVYLKDNCSRERPVFVITGVDWQYNYLQWGDHYYFIDDVVILTNDHMELHCTEDVLATYRDQIGAYSAFIERSSHTYDELLNDSLLSSQQDVTQVRSASTTISGAAGTLTPSPGCYLVNTFGVNGVHLYAYDNLADILGLLNNNAYGVNSSQLAALVQSIGMNLLDVSAYVSNVRWIPFASSALNGATATPEVSFWVLNNFTTKEVSDRAITITGTVTQPVNLYTDWRARNPRFSEYTLYLPGVGTIGLNPLDVYGNTITYTMSFDLFTGEVMYMLYVQEATERHIIGSYSGKLACEIPYSSTSKDVWGVIDTLVGGGMSSGSSAISGASNAGAASAVSGAMAVGQAEVRAVQTVCAPRHSINAAVGNISKIRQWPDIILTIINYGSKDYLTPYAGRPLCEIAQISNIPGYVKCGMPALEIAGLASEREQVNNMLASGFYYE